MTAVERAKRIAQICRKVPQQWTDCTKVGVEDFSPARGFISCRYRVNGGPPVDRVYIVEALTESLTFPMLNAAGIRDASSFFLLAVRSEWGSQFPQIVDSEQAERVIAVASVDVPDVRVVATFRHGRHERDNSEFNIQDWLGATGEEMLSPQKETWPSEDYARDAIIRLRNNKKLQRNVSAFCRKIAEEQGVPEIGISLRKLLYQPQYKRLWEG